MPRLLPACLATFVGAAALAAGVPPTGTARVHGAYYTAARLAEARRQASDTDWGRELRAAAVDRARPWLDCNDADLWALVPGQELGRCIDVTLDRRQAAQKRLGCLSCGEKIFAYGNYPYDPDVAHGTWQLKCPACGAVFPTNDFGAFYRSAIDEHGVFNPARGDRSLLFNRDHPDPKDPLHRFGVDDGRGYVDANGREHRFIGYYAWKHWQWLQGGLKALADAFVLTGEQRYAHKAAVLLDRIADLYPTLDWQVYADRGWFHSDGNIGGGKIEGSIWETNVLRKLAEDYDAVLSGTVGDEDLFRFLRQQGERYRLPRPKGTRELFVANVDEGLLREGFRAVAAGQVRGNEGMHQLTVVALAMALDTAPESGRWLDWLFTPSGGALPGLLTTLLDRDGLSNEAAPGYAHFLGHTLGEAAFRLADYQSYRRHDLLRDFPALRQTFTAAARTALLGVAVPNLGDTGATGLVSRFPISPDFIAKGFRSTGDPSLAVAAWRANGGTTAGLLRDATIARRDELLGEIERAGCAAGPRANAGDLLTGFGLALLESGSAPDGIGLAVNYGRTVHHGHLDQLNFDLFAFGQWLTPDLGYPEFATSWPSRDEWTINTISHNTVVVDGSAQRTAWGGRVRRWERLPGLQLIELESQTAYPEVRDYRRTLLLVTAGTADVPHGYVIDFFRVEGGNEHLYSFHGPPGDSVATGLQLRPQQAGTYAGPAVPFAAPSGTFPRGYSYLYNVRWDPNPPAEFAIDWTAEPGYRGLAADADLHVRLRVLTPLTDTVIAAGDPPQNKPGNPRRIDYALLRRSGSNLKSTFVTVIEPYRGKSLITSVTRETGADDQAIGLKVMLADGTVDHIWWNAAPSAPGRGLVGEGVGFLREKANGPAVAVVAGARSLDFGGIHLTSAGSLRGRVTRFNQELTGGGILWVDTPLPTDGSLNGKLLKVDHAGERDTAYVIRSVTADGSGSRVDCGPVSFVSGYRGPAKTVRGEHVPAQYDLGFEHEIAVGDAFGIPLATVWLNANVTSP